MALIDVSWQPTDRQLRQFGWIALAGLPMLGWLFDGKPWPLADSTQMQQVVLTTLAALGVIAATLAILCPQALRWPFVGAMLLALPLGLVMGEVVLAIIYFLLFLPVSLVFRLIGRDALERGIDHRAKTYWQPKAHPPGHESYFRQS
ncbi:MAG TPA: SxtJ family membrane protein [Pirellulales bacterium]|jgi:hypothetical protein